VDFAPFRDGGGSDGNFTGALGMPTLDGLGVVGAGPHTLEEYLLVSCLVSRTKLLARLFETLGTTGAPCGPDWPHLQASP
jgi:glutamate carboxypeptidase